MKVAWHWATGPSYHVLLTFAVVFDGPGCISLWYPPAPEWRCAYLVARVNTYGMGTSMLSHGGSGTLLRAGSLAAWVLECIQGSRLVW